MRKKLFLSLLCLGSLQVFSQVTFDPGHYVDNSGTRLPVEIKYADWKNNPSDITVRTSKDAAVQVLSLGQVAAFGIDGQAHYIRASVPVDISDPRLKHLSNHGRFESREDTVFLEILLEGRADLLSYRQAGREQFFVRTQGDEIQPLIYKRYVPEKSISIRENRQYQQQLLNALDCEEITSSDIERTAYKRRELSRLFTRYNRCADEGFTNYKEEASMGDAFNLSFRAGVNFSSLSLYTYVVYREIHFDRQPSLRLGLEGEYVLPFLRNKWAFIAEPTFQSYQGEADFPEESLGTGRVAANYRSIEIPFGVRHYFFLNQDNKIFLNATYTVDFILDDSGFTFDTAIDAYSDTKMETNTGTNFSFGAGYTFKKFSLEGRYNLERTLTGKNLGVGSAYDSLSLILGYTFF